MAGHTSTTVTVIAAPATAGTITGAVDTVCMGSSIMLTDATVGGTWGSVNGLVSVVSPGVMNGVTAGIDTVVYTVSNSCGAVKAKYTLSVINCTLGINATRAGDPALKVYPNPNDGGFTVNVSAAANEMVRIIIRNVVGETVKEVTVPANVSTAVALGQPQGIYLLSAYTANGVYTAQIVISK